MATKKISNYAHNSLSPYDGSQGTKFLDARLAGVIKQISDDVNAARMNTPWVFMVRPHGDSNPAASKFIGNQGDIKVIGRHLKMGWFKTKDDYKVCKAGFIDRDQNDQPIAIDGTDGDLLAFFDTEVHHYGNLYSIDGVDYDIFGLGLYPITLYGKASEGLESSGMFADRAVIKDSQSRCFYNKEVNGTGGTANGAFLQDPCSGAGGRPSQGATCLNSMLYAQNKNADKKHGDGWYGLHYLVYQMWFMLQTIELGSVYTCNPAVQKSKSPTDSTPLEGSEGKIYEACKGLGYGCTAMTPQDIFSSEGISGVVIYTSDGNQKAVRSLQDAAFRLSAGGANVSTRICLSSQGYQFIEMLMPQRVANAAMAYGGEIISALTQATATSPFFTLQDDGAHVAGVSNVNVSPSNSTPAQEFLKNNAIPGKFYYQVRNVWGCEGLAEGVMTCVVNAYVKLDISSATCYIDDTPLANGYAIVKFSMPLYRGVTFNVGSFVESCGFHYVIHGKEEGEAKSYWLTQICHKHPKDLPLISSNSTAACYGNESDELLLAQGSIEYEDHLPIAGGWAKSCDWGKSFISFPTVGGGQTSYECAHVWRDYCYGAGVDGKPESGKKCINGAVLGCHANNADPSARTAHCDIAASHSFDDCCSAAALIGIGLNPAPEA